MPFLQQYRHASHGMLRLVRCMKRRPKRQHQALFIFPFILMSSFAPIGIRKDNLRRGRKVTSRITFDVYEHLETIGHELFRKQYRITYLQFESLVCLVKQCLQPFIQRSSMYAAVVSTEVKFCVTLRILAGASYLDVGWPYGIRRSTTYAVFRQTLMALNQTLPKISFPESEEECIQSSLLFQQSRNSPIQGIIAAIDGIVVEIMRPRAGSTPDARKYFNRKGFYSLSVQAAVGADYRFNFVSARHAGGTHDSTALQATKLYDLLQEPAFGILVCRFEIFWTALRYDLSIDTLIVMVACKLHNIIIDTSDDTDFRSIPIAEENTVHVSGPPSFTFKIYSTLSKMLRELDNEEERILCCETRSRKDYIC